MTCCTCGEERPGAYAVALEKIEPGVGKVIVDEAILCEDCVTDDALRALHLARPKEHAA